MYKLLTGILAAGLAVAACGSSKPSASGSSPTSNAGSGDFSSLLEKSKTSAFKVTYKTSGGDTVTIAQDGTGKESVIAGGKVYISDGSTTIACDGTTSSATCRDAGTSGRQAADAAKSVITDTASAIASLASSSLFDGHTSSETIAGRDATCVSVNASDMTGVLGSIARGLGADASGTVCADKETGVLLKLSGGSGDKTSDVFVATDFGEPSASDFQPPSTPVSGPTIPNVTLPTIPSG